MEDNPEPASLVDLVFSWSFDDVLNNSLYKSKVKEIPRSFDCIRHYLNSFIFPLIEETRADICSSLSTMSLAPAWRISCFEISENYQPPKNLICTIKLEGTSCLAIKVESREPEPGDLIALTDGRPESVANFNKLSYLVAYVLRVTKMQNLDEYKLTIQLSKPITSESHIQDKRYSETNFAVFLANLTTNIRIWKALNFQLSDGSFNVLSKVLRVDQSACRNCPGCFHSERTSIDASSTGAMIRSLDLNESQEEAVVSCSALKDCYHKSTVKIIWGPPGTGKTKTIASFLFAMLKMKSRVVTCAPTNIAVVEVAKRLLKLASKSFEYDTYGLGDILLYGNGKRMKIGDHDDLFDIFLDFRVHMLNKCFQRSSGWIHSLNFMICLLEDPEQQYQLFLQNQTINDDDEEEEGLQQFLEDGDDGPDFCSHVETTRRRNANLEYKRKTWKTMIEETIRAGKNYTNLQKEDIQQEKESFLKNRNMNGDLSNEKLTLEQFVKIKFHSFRFKLKFFMTILYTHLPTSYISSKVVRRMIDAVSMLHKLSPFFCCAGVANSDSNIMRNECLRALKSLRERFDTPNVCGKAAVREFCLKNGRLFFCTASGTIKLHEDGPMRLPIVVIDEAAQLKECESAIPLQLPGLRHAILIGDERQLPSMVKSKISEQAKFGRSLFERLVSLDCERHLLNVQYRMHPLISLFSNNKFYQNQILDAPNVREKSYQRHILPGSMYGPYSFIDVTHGQEMPGEGHSLKNLVEVAVVCKIVSKLLREVKANGKMVTVGVISPYKAQVNAIERKLKELDFLGTNPKVSVRVRSVDGFQGGEEDVIIISTVRCNWSGLVGFLSDCRRTNVALTRARYCLWIIGNGETLARSDSVWSNLVVDAKARECFFDAEDDEDLTHAIAHALLDVDQLDEILQDDSLLFKKSRWKVLFGDNFRQSVARIEKMVVQKEVLSLLSQLSSGWRKPHGERYLSFKGGISHLLEYSKVDGMFYLIWSIDIIEEESNYVQILKVWDVLPWFEIPKLATDLSTFFSSYSEERLRCCKLRCMEGNVEVPMTWPIDVYAKGNYLILSEFMEKLVNKLALLTLND